MWMSQKHKNLDILENETIFFLQVKIFVNNTPRATLWQKIVL